MYQGGESPREASHKPEEIGREHKFDFLLGHASIAGKLGLGNDETSGVKHKEYGYVERESQILDSPDAGRASNSSFVMDIGSDIPAISAELCLPIEKPAYSSTTIDSKSKTSFIGTEMIDSIDTDVTSVESPNGLETKGLPCLTQNPAPASMQGNDGTRQCKPLLAKGKPNNEEDPLPRKGSFRGLIPRRNSFRDLIAEKSTGKESLPSRKGSLLGILNRKGSTTGSALDVGHSKDAKSGLASHVVSEPLRRISQSQLEETRGGTQATKKSLPSISPHSEHTLEHSGRRDLSCGLVSKEAMSRTRSSLLSGTPLTYSPSQRSPKSTRADKSSVDAFSTATSPSLSSFTHGANGEAVNEEEIARRIIEMQKQLDKLF